MKKVILLAMLMPYMAFGQIGADFEQGDISNWVQSTEGRWKADTTAAISGEYSLHHSYDNPDSGEDRIGIPITDLHPSQGLTRWSFLIRHGYDPSSSNNWSVFLMCDSEPSEMSPDGESNGFAVGVNLTGYDDTLRLWKVKGGNVTTIVNSRINWQTTVGTADAVNIIIERSDEGNWAVKVFRRNGDIIGASSGTDNELFNPGWFGIFYKYSSTRDRLLWFDGLSIEGVFYQDNEAPVISSCKAYGRNSVEITLDEPLSDDLIVPDNFSLDQSENRPISVKQMNSLTYRIEFADRLSNKTINNLIISNICDNDGNCDHNIRLQFTPVWADPGDVIITEIMADPLPEVSLPGKEYIEITNRTEYPFSLNNWMLISEGQNFLLPETILNPLEVIIICSSKDTSLFAGFGKTTGLKQFPSLTDGGKLLCLYDSSGFLVHGLEYSSGWYKDELKSGGGWSLEMIDTRYPFCYKDNWSASVSRKGGTPGLVNSVSGDNPDLEFYGVQNVFPDDSANITVRFSEPVFDLSENITGITIDGDEIISLFPVDPLFREFSIRTGKPLSARKRYELSVSKKISDFAGNKIQTGSFVFGLPEYPGSQDILFNELLFNPLPGDPDYLEFYNLSEKIIDASRLQLVSINDEVRDTSHLYPVSNERRCIMPGSYYAITADREKIYSRYFSTDPDYLFETGSIPAMSDDEGHLALFNRELDMIDEVSYNEKMHFSLLAGYEGIALEKTGPANKSADPSSWHSASESSGWGTPGAPNSIFAEVPVSEDKVILSSSKISPDSDGNEDILTIGFRLAGNGNVVSAGVFDETGKYVRKLAGNMFIGTEGSLIWDGTADDGSPVRTGIYIIYITLYDDTGKTERWKKVCTVIRR